jgi:molybdenum cofactor cytidylyltransferase
MSAGASHKIAGVVLAAGCSSRMAPRNKLLESIGGEPMVRRVARVAIASGARPIIAVTGYEAPAIAAALSGLEVTTVVNPDYADGLSTSLRRGLRALPPGIDGALICLGDMPGVDTMVLSALMAAFSGAGAICVPVRNGRRGNPVLWGSRHFPEMMEITGDTGAKLLIARHEADVIEVEVSTDSIFDDVDTAAVLAHIKQPGAAS